ncbi:hypothetical protein LSAT2_022626 [Lamellibrachia satsuma]|nr:hypothetical protein LSAT2_022626 [Lamellibrachia satsuma]
MATLADVSEVDLRYRERSTFIDPYRFPNEPHTILRAPVPPCSVCATPRLVEPQLPALCECSRKAKRGALLYSQRVVPDHLEEPPNDGYVKTLPRNLAELYRSVPSCNMSQSLNERLPLNFAYRPPGGPCPERMKHATTPWPLEVPWPEDIYGGWRPKEPDPSAMHGSYGNIIHVTGLHGQPQMPLCRCDLPMYHTFESRVKPAKQYGHPINWRSEALSRIGSGQPLPQLPLAECRSDDSMAKFPMNRELTPYEANRGMPAKLVDFPPKAARLNRWRHT